MLLNVDRLTRHIRKRDKTTQWQKFVKDVYPCLYHFFFFKKTKAYLISEIDNYKNQFTSCTS